MDWFKIKVRDVLNTPLTNEEIGMMVRVQALAAEKERIPYDPELNRIVRQKSLDKLEIKLESIGVNLGLIVEKVLEDVISSAKDRKKTAERVARHRGNSRLDRQNVTRYVTDDKNDCNALDKTNRDKTNRDCINTTNNTNSVWGDENVTGGFCEVGGNPENKGVLELPVDWADTVHRYCVLEGHRRNSISPEKRVGKKDEPIRKFDKFLAGTKTRCLDDRDAFFQIKAELEELEAKAKAQEVAERNNAILQQYRKLDDPTPVKERVAAKLGCEAIDVVPGYHDNYIIQVMIEIAEESRRGGKPGPTHDDFLEIARRVIWVRNQTGEGVPTPDAELLARAYSMSPDEFGDAMLEITEFEVNQIELEGRI
jgi:hypothetical protein